MYIFDLVAANKGEAEPERKETRTKVNEYNFWQIC
jgi:hypothetical protein